MADPFSTVAAVVSLADVMIRACEGISNLIVGLKDASDAAQHLRQTVQNVKSLLGNLQLYVNEYESSNLSLGQHQLLPETVKKELLEIRTELDLLQQFLPLSGTQEKIGQRVKLVFNEKKISKVVRRLESRQIALGTGLQIVAQRTGIKIYENVSNIREDMQQFHMSTANRLLETQSSISRQLDKVARAESNSLTEQVDTLNEIRMLAEPIPGNHTTTINKLDKLSSILASMRMNEGHLQSNRTLQASTTDVLRRLLRAELKRVVMPTVEEYLDSYKSSHNVQLEGIRRNLDQIVQDLGHSSKEEAMTDHTEGSHSSATCLDEIEAQEICPRPRKSKTEDMDHISGAVGLGTLSDNPVVKSWTLSWTRSWVFRWRIGRLIVTVSTSHSRSRHRRRECQAFETFRPSSARYSYRVSVDFQPAPCLLVTRGISVMCESRQDQRGYYQICPMMTNFAIIPDSAEVFSLIMDHDITGLQGLFEERLAAPTDRDDFGLSLLHLASYLGYSEVCEFLLREGADLSATYDYFDSNSNIILIAQKQILLESSVPRGSTSNRDYYATIRAFIRAGCDVVDAFEDLLGMLVIGIRGSLWEDPQQSLVDWTTFLCDLGMNVNSTTSLMSVLENPEIIPPEVMEYRSNMVFLSCLLKADVSLRTTGGFQALHLLIWSNKWSAEFSPHFIDLAYILIRFGGADVYACDKNNDSPTMLALELGWLDEWVIVLFRCGLDPVTVIRKDIDRINKFRRLGDGESTAVDTEDLVSQVSGAMTLRRSVVGDRLDD